MPPDTAIARLTGRPGQPHPVPGVKFAPDGTALPFAGNTVLCPLPPEAPEHAALAAIAAELAAAPGWGTKLVALDPASFHMTVFNGVHDRARHPQDWPAGLPLDASVPGVTRHFADCLNGFHVPGGFTMRPTALGPTSGGGTVLWLEPQDVATAQRLAALRQALARRLGLRRASHGRYAFHLTLNYSLAWLDPPEAAGLTAAQRRLGEAFAIRYPVLRFPAPSLCAFETLNAFRPVLRLG
ncbi:DUF1868 domain-containing protein [Roseomonas sp. E05]|uniref:DUF1868 domain-containing protein n=1 Tax=Roseomonas sp. E05 TaxID=3046310 RepID=UPI0024B9E468|nr:DUF1868 domain-containing protein [Roseomonas sp. E05]MDJ0389266.1 DUF1868 domain-containing protein [Roseomonas sp. E05]